MKKRIFLLIISVVLTAIAFILSGASNLFDSLTFIPLQHILIILLLLTANIFIVSFRLKRILFHFGQLLPGIRAIQATVSGLLASLFVFSLLGQVLGRHIFLTKYNVSPTCIASAFAYERGILLLTGSTLGLVGGYKKTF